MARGTGRGRCGLPRVLEVVVKVVVDGCVTMSYACSRLKGCNSAWALLSTLR